ncbi:hypothetical protein B9479_000418 [Cryptococcus floricola]|uniref:Uncharacterized protein n=1 Tax=Cryptococcus floricola TaxID=2591691 RepID=A0A5D3B8H9_9TREE|nr:hypothetical protein B9479_000418 [Cryptococcus floricola]
MVCSYNVVVPEEDSETHLLPVLLSHDNQKHVLPARLGHMLIHIHVTPALKYSLHPSDRSRHLTATISTTQRLGIAHEHTTNERAVFLHLYIQDMVEYLGLCLTEGDDQIGRPVSASVWESRVWMLRIVIARIWKGFQKAPFRSVDHDMVHGFEALQAPSETLFTQCRKQVLKSELPSYVHPDVFHMLEMKAALALSHDLNYVFGCLQRFRLEINIKGMDSIIAEAEAKETFLKKKGMLERIRWRKGMFSPFVDVCSIVGRGFTA